MQILTAFLVLIAVVIAQTTPENLDLLGPDYKPISSLQIYYKYNATSDAIDLFEAMDGPGTTENVIISIMSHRTEEQRKIIAEKYKELHGQDLMEDLKDDLSGDLEDIITGLLEGPSLFLATRLHKALVEGWFTDETAIIDIIAPLTSEEIAQVESEYNKKYQTSLVDELSKGKNDFYRRFLLSMVKNSRRQHEMPSEEEKAVEFKRFLSAVDNMDPLDENTFKTVLLRREPSYVRQLFNIYTKASGRKVEENIKEQTSGTMRDTLLAIVESIQNRAEYFARRLHRAMDGFGTDEEALTRVLVSRAEKDLGNIKLQYEKLFGRTLLTDIEDDMSGEDRDAMVALIV